MTPASTIRGLTFAALLASATIPTGIAQADEPVSVSDVWSDTHRGVRYLRRTTSDPAVVHALVIDLDEPGVRIEATRRDDRFTTVSEFAEREGAAAAINGGFWSSFSTPFGLQVGADGQAWPNGDEFGETSAFIITGEGRALIRGPNGSRMGNRGYRSAVSGIPLLLSRGYVQTQAIGEIGAASQRHPRTAVGVSRDGRTVYLVVVDGRRHGSRGLNLYQLAKLMRDLGAYRAMNLDGGGSSTMFVRGVGGVVSAPSGGRWESQFGFGAEERPVDEGAAMGLTPPPTKTRTLRGGQRQTYVRGIEREVMNHLGVFAEPHTHTAAASGAGGDVLDVRVRRPAEIVLPPRQTPWRLGRLREHLRWALPSACALFVLLLLYRGRRRIGSFLSSRISRGPMRDESA